MFAALLLGAHFLRAGNPVAMVACVAAPLLLLFRKPWVLYIGPLLLVVGGFIWTHLIIELLRLRMALGEPWLRLVLILSGVALLTFASALVFRTKRFQQRYGATTHSTSISRASN